VTGESESTRRVGRYEVERELAEGGMGVVYLALQPQLERPVVLKRMHRDLQGDEEAEQRFLREARTAAAIHHPNVVGVYDCFTWRGEPYIACEYVDGLDAASALTRAGRFPPRIAALIALEIARGLEELHARALVHRDLKPDNVLLGRAGEVKITDFGIAHDPKEPSLTRSGISLGTPAYMSPEQIRGERVDFRADLFALGAVLYELLAGATPFAQPDTSDVDAEPSQLRRIERGAFRPLRRAAPGTPRALAKIVHRCLRAKPKRRVASAAELRSLLERHVGTAAPADTRREIAAWLDDRKLIAARGRTKRAKREEDGELELSPRVVVRRAFRLALAAAVAGLVATLAFGHLELSPRPADWPILSKRWLPQGE
jgi:serine/threonine-protein kinase